MSELFGLARKQVSTGTMTWNEGGIYEHVYAMSFVVSQAPGDVSPQRRSDMGQSISVRLMKEN